MNYGANQHSAMNVREKERMGGEREGERECERDGDMSIYIPFVHRITT